MFNPYLVKNKFLRIIAITLCAIAFIALLILGLFLIGEITDFVKSIF